MTQTSQAYYVEPKVQMSLAHQPGHLVGLNDKG